MSASLRAADLLFFSDRADKHPTHVGLSLGEGRMVHLALGRGGYSVERLNDRKDVYVEKLQSEIFVWAESDLNERLSALSNCDVMGSALFVIRVE